jgi:hypothetical protein
MNQIIRILASSLFLVLLSFGAQAQTTKSKNKRATGPQVAVPAPARGPSGVNDSDKVFEVRGQSRNLSMMLVLKNRKDNIDFVKARENFASEIKETSY